MERGQRLLAQGNFRGAASLLADAARLVPEDPRIANAYGRALLGLGSRDRALHQFERAARLDTGVAAYRIDYARALAEAGRVREAAREYEAVAAFEPGNVAASEGLLRLQQSSGSGAGSTERRPRGRVVRRRARSRERGRVHQRGPAARRAARCARPRQRHRRLHRAPCVLSPVISAAPFSSPSPN